MHLIWLACFIPIPIVLSALVNATIDNKFGDPLTGAQFSYSPNGAWFDGPGCVGCSATPDATMAFDHNWIEGTFDSQHGVNAFPNVVLTASVNFTGTSVYVFCIVSNSLISNLTFFIDGHVVGTFLNTPTGALTYDYNVPVYVNTSLASKEHSFVLQNGGVNGPESLVLFDYLTYTFNDGSSSSSHSGSSSISQSNTLSRGEVVAAIFGTVIGLLLVALVIVWFGRRRKTLYKIPFTDIHMSLKLPKFSWPPGRQTVAASPAVRPTFNPTLLVQRKEPAPVTFKKFPPHPYAMPSYNDHVSSSSAWATTRLEPQRRQESEAGTDGNVLNIHRQQRKGSRGLGNSHRPPFSEEVDLSSHYDDSAVVEQLQAPSSPPPTHRQFTVRNN